MSNDRAKALRASFDDVLEAQGKLRKKLHELILETKPIQSYEEEEEFRKLLDKAAVGLERRPEVVVSMTGTATRTPPNDDKKIEMTFKAFQGKLSELIRATLLLSKTNITLFSDAKECRYADTRELLQGTITIDRFWEKILQTLESEVFPAARELVFQASPERMAKEKQQARSDW
ncbi:hypothetical protein AKJ66_00410 [candidate division MSBL1 archaeon SCGC-AAA259E22]|uniref:Uncharacterized protein n=1 Tax=candidate division MSBL1 archaeon SCGC-AAA259E22 TaxID=1698265 RepID=A0A133UI97_9EURY|nr:hypothetical protein AKJ66_00410 [candidate division MSBL1 archaeon SCGC-AAA259E22]